MDAVAAFRFAKGNVYELIAFLIEWLDLSLCP